MRLLHALAYGMLRGIASHVYSLLLYYTGGCCLPSTGAISASCTSVAWKGSIMKSERICFSRELFTFIKPPKSTSFSIEVLESRLVVMTCVLYQLLAVGAAQIMPSGTSDAYELRPDPSVYYVMYDPAADTSIGSIYRKYGWFMRNRERLQRCIKRKIVLRSSKY